MIDSIPQALAEVVRDLRRLNTDLGDEAAYIIEKLGRGARWSGIRRRPWTTTEIRFLEERRDKMTPAEIAYALGRTSNSVKWMKRCLGKNIVTSG